MNSDDHQSTAFVEDKLMVRRKNLKVGPRMRAAAAERLAEDGLSTNFRSSEKAALFEELAKSLADTIRPAPLPEQEIRSDNRSDPEKQLAEILKLLADVSTGLWRLRSKMLPVGAKEPSDENRKSYKQLEAILDTLREAGVEIRDHTGEAVPGGGIYTLNVLTYEPTSGLMREQVIETIKPTIYLKDEVIQVGQVIIGTPETSAN